MYGNQMIDNIETSQLVEIIQGLVMKGLTFKAIPQPGMPDGWWRIVLTGGF